MNKHLSFILLIFFVIGFSINSYSQQYNESDKEGIRKFLRQGKNYELAGLKTSDTLIWHSSEEWITKNSISFSEVNLIKLPPFQLSWIDGRLAGIAITNYTDDLKGKSYTGFLDCSPFASLIGIYSFNNNLDSINISKNENLHYLLIPRNKLTSLNLGKSSIALDVLDISHNQIESLDLSNCVNLASIIANNNKLTELYLFNNKKLSNLDASHNFLSQIDLSKNQSLSEVILSYNLLKNIDIPQNTSIYRLDVEYNHLTSLYIPKNTGVMWLFFHYNDLSLSNLINYMDMGYLKYSPQNKLYGQEIGHNQIIDLSKEYSIEEFITSFQWFDEDGQQINLISKGNGIFMAGDKYIGKKLTCKMQNGYLPGITSEYEISIIEGKTETINVIGNLRLKTIEDDLHQVSPGESFKINTPININLDQVQIGLFSNDGITLLENITESRKNTIFTCKVSDNIYDGNYILQPYIKNADGNISIIERAEGSFILDKLPITITGNDIWNKSVPKSDLTLSSHLQLKTAQANKYAVEQNVNFMVYAPQPSATTRIGLFTTQGILMEDITLSRKNNTFTCKVSANIPVAAYIIVPYEKTDGNIKIIERETGRSLIDKLPLSITDENIWSSKTSDDNLSTIDRRLSIQPNPVTDMFTVQTTEKTELVEIYSVSGKLIKTIENQTQITIHELDPGIYLVKIKTDKEIYSQKIIKK